MPSYLLAMDLGTSGVKVALFDTEGRLRDSAYGEYPTEFPRDGWAEQRPMSWWETFCGLTRELLERTSIPPGSIACVCPSGQMSAVIPIGADGGLLTERCIIWADMRAKEETAKALEAAGGYPAFYRLTGGGYSPESYCGFKLAWLRRHEPGLFSGTRVFLPGAKDFMGYLLTGRTATDYSDASHTGLLDHAAKDWSDLMLAAVGVPREKLPPLRLAQSLLGHVTGRAAKQTGLLEGTPVCVGGGDVAIAATGAAAHQPNAGFILLGSGIGLSVYTGAPVFDLDNHLSNTVAVDAKGYVCELGNFGGGITYRWLRDLLSLPGRRAPSFAEMDAWALRSAPGAGGLLFNPNMRGGGAPYCRPETRGAFVGLSLSHSAGDLCRAVMEGVAFTVRQLLEVMEGGGLAPRELRLTGGGACGTVWRQIIADILRRPLVVTPMTQQTNTWGAAICGGLCAGIWKEFSECGALAGERTEVIPRPERSERYDSLYPLFVRSYEKLLPDFRALMEYRQTTGEPMGGNPYE